MPFFLNPIIKKSRLPMSRWTAVFVLQAYAGKWLFFCPCSTSNPLQQKVIWAADKESRGWGLKGHKATSHACVQNCKDRNVHNWLLNIGERQVSINRGIVDCSKGKTVLIECLLSLGDLLKEDFVNARCFLHNVWMDEGTKRQPFDIPLKKIRTFFLLYYII